MGIVLRNGDFGYLESPELLVPCYNGHQFSTMLRISSRKKSGMGLGPQGTHHVMIHCAIEFKYDSYQCAHCRRCWTRDATWWS